MVYTARSEALNNAVIPEFEKDTGIKVEVVVAGTRIYDGSDGSD